MTSRVRVIGMTKPVVLDLPTPEDLIVYQARVSAPKNQQKMLDGTVAVAAAKFIQSCKDRGEWSVFQMVNINLEIIAPRDISRQFTRHESMAVVEIDEELAFVPDGFGKHAGGVQEFSQRYAAVMDTCEREARAADPDDRQNSIEGGLTFYAEQFASTSNEEVLKTAMSEYQTRLENGEAKETARVILPEGLVMSRLYVNGTVRSWMHYLDAREKHATQKEHRELAAQIRLALAEVLPLIFAEAA